MFEMYRESIPIYAVRHGQRGAGLMAAIALITVVAAFAAGILSLLRMDAQSGSLELVDSWALNAAHSGAELALNRLVAPLGTGSCVARTFNFDQDGLKGCQASVSCNTTVTLTQTIYTLASEGRCDVGGMVAVREVVVRATL